MRISAVGLDPTALMFLTLVEGAGKSRAAYAAQAHLGLARCHIAVTSFLLCAVLTRVKV